MQKVFRITVDISKKIPAPAFEVNTNDLKSVKLEITITNGQSLLDLTDVTPRINIRKPDNEVIFQDCEIVDAKAGKVQIVLENQAYLVPGTHTAEIACYKGNEITAITGTFSYKSIKGIMNDAAVESKSEFTAITRKIEEARKLLEDIGENGVGVDEQARQEIQEVTAQLADTSQRIEDMVTINIKQPPYNAPTDGVHRPLSERFSTLKEAQKIFPVATALHEGIHWAAIQSAMNKVEAMGGGTVYLPKGEYILDRELLCKTKVSLKGAGIGQTKLITTKLNSAISFDLATASETNPYEDFTYSDFEIDGSRVNYTTYQVRIKGIFIQYLRRCVFRDLYIHDTVATGLGIDFLDQCVIDNVTVENCGRGFVDSNTTLGASGIGIGTGGMPNENCVIVNNTARNCGQYGIFIEDQQEFDHTPHHEPEGVIVANNIVKGGRYNGIGVKNGGRAIVSDNYVYGAANYGIAIINGAYNVSLKNNVTYGNGVKDLYIGENTKQIIERGTEGFKDFTAETLLHEFPMGETLTFLGTGKLAGTPTGKQGNMVTYRPNIYGDWGTQFFYEKGTSTPTDKQKVFYRTSRANAGTPMQGIWNNWTELTSGFGVSATNAYSCTTAHDTFPKNSVTHTEITSTNLGGTPNNQAGVLITDRTTGNNYLTTQTFKEKSVTTGKTSKVYTRTVLGDLTWGTWSQVIEANASERVSIPNTNDGNVATLEAELNKVKNQLRALGIIS